MQQGPKAAHVVQKHLPAGVDLAQQNFMTTQNATLAGAPDCILSRCVRGRGPVGITVRVRAGPLLAVMQYIS